MQIVKSELLENGMRYTAGQPEGVCSYLMEVITEGDTIRQVRVTGGCDGNLQGISRLVVGQKIEDVVERVEGIDCNGKGTSCPDQLSQLLQYIVDNDLK